MTVFPNPYESKPSLLVRIGVVGRGLLGRFMGSGIAIALSIGWHAPLDLILSFGATGVVTGIVNRNPIMIGLIACVLSMFLLSISYAFEEYGRALIPGYLFLGLVFGSMIGAIWALMRRGLADNDR